MKDVVREAALAAFACLALAPFTPALAGGPEDDVKSPIVEAGEKEFELKAGTAKNRDGSRLNVQAAALGIGVSRWWFTEIQAIWHKEPGERQSFDAWEWENHFQFTETGKYPVDVGFLLEIERPRDRSEGYEYRWGPLFQGDIGKSFTANFNVLVEKHIRTQAPARAELEYQGQLRYRWREDFHFGLQAFGNVGPWDHWERSSQQSHILGPAVFGELKVFGEKEIKYNAGVLFGLTDGSARNTLRLQAEYEF
jgi:hypothetical protein